MNIDPDDNEDIGSTLERAHRIEARQFARLFVTADGKAVLAAIKRDAGYDQAAPVPDATGHISTERIRDWIGARSVIGSILHKISVGSRLIENPNHQEP